MALPNGIGNGTQDAQEGTQKAQEITFAEPTLVLLLVFCFVLFVFLLVPSPFVWQSRE
jgi:hypothetical protein